MLFLREEQHSYSHRVPVRHNARIKEEMARLPGLIEGWLADGGHHRHDKTLSETAASLGVSSSALYYYFQKKMGEDFRSWRTKKRIGDAKKLLLEEPDTPVFQIGERVGYSDRSNFTRNFRLLTGVTPARWRQQHLGEEVIL